MNLDRNDEHDTAWTKTTRVMRVMGARCTASLAWSSQNAEHLCARLTGDEFKMKASVTRAGETTEGIWRWSVSCCATNTHTFQLIPQRRQSLRGGGREAQWVRKFAKAFEIIPWCNHREKMIHSISSRPLSKVSSIRILTLCNLKMASVWWTLKWSPFPVLKKAPFNRAHFVEL